jgi:hypothetical protein
MLPIIEYPIYTTTLPSTKKKIKYRSFTVKEQKLLLIALEDIDDHDQIFSTIKQIIDNCTLNKLDVDSLAPYDIEHMFIQLRIKSMGENLDLSFKCRNIVDDKVCGNVQTVNLDLSKVKVEMNKKHIPLIELGNDIGFEMMYPTTIKPIPSEAEEILRYVSSMIKSIYSGDELWKGSDISEEDMVDWVESLPPEAFDKMIEFTQTIPTVKAKVNFTCNVCGYKEHINMEGLQDFFG